MIGKPWLIKEVAQSCPHNNMVDCSGASASCSTCGWNPEVAKKRIKKWQRAYWYADFSDVVAKIRRLNKQ